VARYGANNSVIFLAKDETLARSNVFRLQWHLHCRTLQHIFEHCSAFRPDGIFIDGGGVGGGVVDQLPRQASPTSPKSQFGGKDDITGVVFDNAGERYANSGPPCTAHAPAGSKPAFLPNDADLRNAMLAIRYTFNRNDEIQLVAKEELLADNPGLILDDLDASS